MSHPDAALRATSVRHIYLIDNIMLHFNKLEKGSNSLTWIHICWGWWNWSIWFTVALLWSGDFSHHECGGGYMFEGNRNARLGHDRAIFPYCCNWGRSTHRVGILDEGRTHYKFQLSIKLLSNMVECSREKIKRGSENYNSYPLKLFTQGIVRLSKSLKKNSISPI